VKAEDLKEEVRALTRVLATPDGKKFMQGVERVFVWGDPPKGSDRELYEWLGARDFVLHLRSKLNAAEQTGTDNGRGTGLA